MQFDTRAVANWFLTRPNGWQSRLGALPHVLQKIAGPGARTGRDRVRRFLRELEAAGYLARARSRKPDGRWVWRVEFSDTPEGRAGLGAAMDGSAVDGQGVHLLYPLKHLRLNNSVPTTATPAAMTAKSWGTGPKVVVPAIEVRYPEFLSGSLFTPARHLLQACPVQHRQPVLDEIGAMYVRRKVRSPFGLLRSLVQNARLGDFRPNQSLILSPSRMQEDKQEDQCTANGNLPSLGPVLLSAMSVFLNSETDRFCGLSMKR